jgi:putative intracellular protease/amidase
VTSSIAFVLFDGAEELDFVGPWEVFTMAGAVLPGECTAFTVSEHGGEIRCAKGLRVLADYSFKTCPAANMVIVPGGRAPAPKSKTPP